MQNEIIGFKIILIGNKGCGKTKLVERYVNNNYNETYVPTEAVNFLANKENIEGKSYGLQIWEIDIQEKNRPIRNVYYREAIVAIICYDSTEPIDLNAINAYIQELNQGASNPDFLIVATKCDTEKGIYKISESQINELRINLENPQQIIHFETNAKLNICVHEVFKKAAILADERLSQLPNDEEEDTGILLHSISSSSLFSSKRELIKLTYPDENNIFWTVYKRFINKFLFEGPREDQLQEFGNIYQILNNPEINKPKLSYLFSNEINWKVNRAHHNLKHIYSQFINSLWQAQKDETALMSAFDNFKKWIEKTKQALSNQSGAITYQDQDRHQEVLAALNNPQQVKKPKFNWFGL